MTEKKLRSRLDKKILAGVTAGAAVPRPPEPEPQPMTDEQVVQATATFIGIGYTPSVKDTIKKITARPVVGPNDLVSRDLNPSRIHVRADENGIIKGFTFG